MASSKNQKLNEHRERIAELEAALKKCYRGFDHIHMVAVETPVRQDAIQGKAEIQRVMDTSDLSLAEGSHDE